MTEITTSLRLYLNEIGSIPLLNASEESRLGNLVTMGDTDANDHLASSDLKTGGHDRAGLRGIWSFDRRPCGRRKLREAMRQRDSGIAFKNARCEGNLEPCK